MTEDEFNGSFIVGQLVYLVLDDGSRQRARLRSKAWTLGHGAVVASVTGKTGGWLIERIRPADNLKELVEAATVVSDQCEDIGEYDRYALQRLLHALPDGLRAIAKLQSDIKAMRRLVESAEQIMSCFPERDSLDLRQWFQDYSARPGAENDE